MQIVRFFSYQPWQYLAFLVSLAFLGFNYYEHAGYAVDDAYISFRYLDNFLNGYGLVFNPGEKVEGYTNFLWILTLIPLRLAGLSPELASLLVNIACTLLLFIAVYHSSRYLAYGAKQAGWISCILLAGYGSLSHWISAGMEPIMAATLIALANLYVIRDKQVNTKSSILYGLAVLTRPDCLLFAVVTFLYFLPFKSTGFINKLKPYVLQAAVFISLPLLHTLFRWLYYGDPLPNTYYAKMHPDAVLMWRFGAAYVERFLVAGGALLIAFSLFGFSARSYRKQYALLSMLLVQVILFATYIAKVGGDYMLFFRFFVPLAPILVITTGVAIWSMIEKLKFANLATPFAGGVIAFGLTLMLLNSSDMRQSAGVRLAHRDNEIFAQWLSQTFPKESLLAMNLVGLVPYRTGMPVIDMLGLNDKHIALAKIARIRPETGTYIGHFKYDGNYVCEKQPDILVPTTLGLHYAQNANQALWDTLRRSYDSDREFLGNAKCATIYKPYVRELAPNKFAVIYIKNN